MSELATITRSSILNKQQLLAYSVPICPSFWSTYPPTPNTHLVMISELFGMDGMEWGFLVILSL